MASCVYFLVSLDVTFTQFEQAETPNLQTTIKDGDKIVYNLVKYDDIDKHLDLEVTRCIPIESDPE